MKESIDKLLGKEEIKKISEKDSEARANPEVPLEDDPNKKYSVSDGLKDFHVTPSRSKSRKRETESIDDEFDEEGQGPSESEALFIEEKVSSSYNSLKSDIARLENYEELSKQYKLTAEQMESASEIYGRLKDAASSATDTSGKYQGVNEKIKEFADVSKKIMNEISGDYISKSFDYKIG